MYLNVAGGSSCWRTYRCPAATVSTSQAVDLRVQPVDEVLERVARSLQVRLLPNSVVRKRRSVGARTDHETWVRIERRLLDKITDQGWNGAECAARLDGVAQPAWQGCVVWRDTNEQVMWRADETDLLPAGPVGNAILSEAPELSDEWWDGLNASLDALAAHQTRRVATPDTETITQTSVTEAIRDVFPGDFDTTVQRWVPAHADLNRANVTAPVFSLFDWEDWGNAPQGLDSASLWASSLAVPSLADRVRQERRRDFESRDGKLMTLFVCSKILQRQVPEVAPESRGRPEDRNRAGHKPSTDFFPHSLIRGAPRTPPTCETGHGNRTARSNGLRRTSHGPSARGGSWCR